MLRTLGSSNSKESLKLEDHGISGLEGTFRSIWLNMPSCLLLQLLSRRPCRGTPGFTCVPPVTGRSPPLKAAHSILTSLALFRYLSSAILFLLSTPAESPFLRKDVLRGFSPILHPILVASQTLPSELQLLPHYPVEN